MAILIDTSVLGRLANTHDSKFTLASDAVFELHRRGEILHVVPQVLIEFRNVATRPTPLNDLGLSIADAESLSAMFESRFSVLDETPAIFPAWKDLVGKLGVIGKQVHDARLVATCHVCRVTHILSFNIGHFTRLASYGPGVAIIDPATV